ncbi:MAG: protein phosphatase [Massilia sp.]|nr:protein phosphatase [Massilia sp.]
MFEHLNFGARLDVAAHSAVGAGPVMRSENQDNCLLIDAAGNAAFLAGGLPQTVAVAGWPPGHVRLAVLDGMGGHGHGREAAEAVAAGLLAIPACRDVDALSTHLNRLHGALQRQFDALEESTARPGTTLTLLELPPDGNGDALLWHVGDSRLYEIAGGCALPLTVDHVPATVLATAGLVEEDAWRHHVHGRHGPQIAQAFILGNTFADPARLDDDLFALTPDILPPWLRALPDRRAILLRSDALYLLATDGFWSCLDPAGFVARWPSLMAHEAASGAIAALFREMETRPPAGLQPDNLTAIALRVRNPGHDETALPQDG